MLSVPSTLCFEIRSLTKPEVHAFLIQLDGAANELQGSPCFCSLSPVLRSQMYTPRSDLSFLIIDFMWVLGVDSRL